MKNTQTIVFAVSFLAAMLLAAPAFAQQITRTDWQMHEGQDVIILAKKLSGSGPAEAFEKAAVPAEKDKGWKPAPDGKIIAFGGPTASKLPKDKCNHAVDYTYFQTFVDVPTNAKVTEFKITFEGMDDASRITIFNKANTSGTIVDGSYVKRGERGTTDLHSLITAGPNRIVVTQVDSCAIGNQLAKAEVVLNGQTIAPAVVKAPASSAGSTLFLRGEKLGRGNRHVMEGHYVTFQKDGNLCVYTTADNRFVWCVNNDPKINYQAADAVELTKEGQLVMRDAKGAVLWAAPAKPNPGARVVLSPSGALELRDGANALLWTSKP